MRTIRDTLVSETAGGIKPASLAEPGGTETAYAAIAEAFAAGDADAALGLHEAVRAALAGPWSDRKTLDIIRCAYAAADRGRAMRRATLNLLTEDKP